MTIQAPLSYPARDHVDGGDGRDALIARYGIERGAARGAFDDVTAFLARLCDAPVALVTVIGSETQWILGGVGVEDDHYPRPQAFCDHAIRSDELFEVRDTRADSRFAEHPLVVGEPHLRFYAGMPLVTHRGDRLGAVCVLDTVPRPDGLTSIQRDGLAMMAKLAMARLDDRRIHASRVRSDDRAARALARSEERFRILADTMPQMVWSTLPDGFHDYYNARWYAFTGVPEGSTDGEEWNGVFHPEDQERAWGVWRHSLATGEPYQIEYRLRHFDGSYRWVLGRALPMRDDAGAITRWFGTCTDIHEQKLASDEREIISQELSHRIKNIFAVVAGLVSFAARARPEFAPAAADLRERITALGRAHDFVRPHSVASRPSVGQDSLQGLLGEIFRPYQWGETVRVRIEGDDIAIDDRSATPFALLFHELATNAAKYGALSVEKGQVVVAIAHSTRESTLTWTERGGPPADIPATGTGFGSQLIELSAVRQLGGRVERLWRNTGLELTVAIPNTSFKR